MCYGCWNDSEQARIDNEQVRAVAVMIAQIYENHCTGGMLHIVLDDWNIEDHNIRWCLDEAITEAANGGYGGDIHPDDLALMRRCGEAMLALTEEERASALALYDGFWESPHLTRQQMRDAAADVVRWDD